MRLLRIDRHIWLRHRGAELNKKTLRTVRKDMTILTSIALLGLVGLSVLSGMGMDDEVEGLFLMDDDIHAMLGYTMALVAGLHPLLHLGDMWTYMRRRVRAAAGESTPQRSGMDHQESPINRQ